jgi:hypothetical protein
LAVPEPATAALVVFGWALLMGPRPRILRGNAAHHEALSHRQGGDNFLREHDEFSMLARTR